MVDFFTLERCFELGRNCKWCILDLLQHMPIGPDIFLKGRGKAGFNRRGSVTLYSKKNMEDATLCIF